MAHDLGLGRIFLQRGDEKLRRFHGPAPGLSSSVGCGKIEAHSNA
jgi:hypothetical protein